MEASRGNRTEVRLDSQILFFKWVFKFIMEGWFTSVFFPTLQPCVFPILTAAGSDFKGPGRFKEAN